MFSSPVKNVQVLEPMSAVVCVVVWRWRGEAGLCAVCLPLLLCMLQSSFICGKLPQFMWSCNEKYHFTMAHYGQSSTFITNDSLLGGAWSLKHCLMYDYWLNLNIYIRALRLVSWMECVESPVVGDWVMSAAKIGDGSATNNWPEEVRLSQQQPGPGMHVYSYSRLSRLLSMILHFMVFR